MTYKTGTWGNQAKERSRKRNEYFKNRARGRRSETRQYIKRIYQEYKDLALNTLGNKCIECGFADWRALQIDHINGGGNQAEKHISGVYKYRDVIRSIEQGEKKYQLLCANCNFIKRYTHNELGKGGDI